MIRQRLSTSVRLDGENALEQVDHYLETDLPTQSFEQTGFVVLDKRIHRWED